MFLNQLNESEKEAFLSLGVHASNADGDFAEEEKAMLQEYCKEMDIDSFDVNNVKSMDEIISLFASSEVTIKRIVLLEILGLLLSDNLFDELEESFINDFTKKIGLEISDVEKEKKLLKKYLEVYKEMCDAIYL